MRPLFQRPKCVVSNSNTLAGPGPLVSCFSTEPRPGRAAEAIQSPAKPTCTRPSACCRTVNCGLVISLFMQTSGVLHARQEDKPICILGPVPSPVGFFNGLPSPHEHVQLCIPEVWKP